MNKFDQSRQDLRSSEKKRREVCYLSTYSSLHNGNRLTVDELKGVFYLSLRYSNIDLPKVCR